MVNLVRSAAWNFRSLAAALLAIAVADSALAVEFESGELRGSIDTTVSVGASMRVHERDCDLVFSGNGGCNPNPAWSNADDGNLNYDKGDLFSAAAKATVDLRLDWRNYGAFLRGSLFYDLVTMDTHTERTDLDRDARYRSSPFNSGVVGMGAQLLDAYLWGNFEVAGRPLELRVGNQVINWGESLFFPGGAALTNSFDVARLRTPGSQVREALVPAPILRLSMELFENLGVEVYYQGYWTRTQIDPVGSYFSTNDLVGRAADGSYLGADAGSRDMDPDDVFEEAFAVDPVITQIFPPTGDPLQDVFIPIFRTLGSDPSTITRIPSFFPVGIPRLEDDEPKSQGQWGAALRYYLESIQTEFGLYYLRIHDKNPSVGFVADPFDLVINTFLIPESFPETFLGFPIRELLPMGPVDTTVQRTSVPVGFFREYPEDIDIFAASFATELFGVALQGEVSYRTRQPVAITSGFLEALARAETEGQRVRVSGFVREKMLQTQLSGIVALGPGHPIFGPLVECLGVDTLSIASEIAMVRFPGLEPENAYAGPGFTDGSDETSWGYALQVQGDYTNPFDIPITLTPRIAFQHDVDGNSPLGPTTFFVEHRKSLSFGATLDYLGVWQFDVAYTNFYGASTRNLSGDRDFVSASLTYSF